MTQTVTDTDAGADDAVYASQVPWENLYQLDKFRWDNTPTYLRVGAEPDPSTPRHVSDEELRQLLMFAGGHAQHPDKTLPRTLEALRVVWLVPTDLGAKLFGN